MTFILTVSSDNKEIVSADLHIYTRLILCMNSSQTACTFFR